MSLHPAGQGFLKDDQRPASFPQQTLSSRPVARLNFEGVESHEVDLLDLTPLINPIFSPLYGKKWTFLDQHRKK